jgi:hypothetical protein
VWRAVIRSKGFFWMSNSHSVAYYWSHAGAHFEIREEGDWWVTVPVEDWPADGAQKDVILSDFDLATTYGDRRQEIVFIGASMEQVRASALTNRVLLRAAVTCVCSMVSMDLLTYFLNTGHPNGHCELTLIQWLHLACQGCQVGQLMDSRCLVDLGWVW